MRPSVKFSLCTSVVAFFLTSNTDNVPLSSPTTTLLCIASVITLVYSSPNQRPDTAAQSEVAHLAGLSAGGQHRESEAGRYRGHLIQLPPVQLKAFRRHDRVTFSL